MVSFYAELVEVNKMFRIFRNDGTMDLELEDGVYNVKGRFTIIDGKIKGIDDSTWTKE